MVKGIKGQNDDTGRSKEKKWLDCVISIYITGLHNSINKFKIDNPSYMSFPLRPLKNFRAAVEMMTSF